MLWYPGGIMNSNYLIYLLRFFFLQLIPAILLDLLMIVFGQKPWLYKMQMKIFTSLNKIEYFMKTQWNWENNNFRRLYQTLSDSDQITFNFDATNLDYRGYINDWIFGSRKYVLRQEESSIPSAKSKLRILYWADLILQLIFYTGIAYLILKFWGPYSGIHFQGEPIFECSTCSKFSFKK